MPATHPSIRTGCQTARLLDVHGQPPSTRGDAGDIPVAGTHAYRTRNRSAGPIARADAGREAHERSSATNSATLRMARYGNRPHMAKWGPATRETSSATLILPLGHVCSRGAERRRSRLPKSCSANRRIVGFGTDSRYNHAARSRRSSAHFLEVATTASFLSLPEQPGLGIRRASAQTRISPFMRVPASASSTYDWDRVQATWWRYAVRATIDDMSKT